MIPPYNVKTGLLPPGRHPSTINEFKQVFVDNFPKSKSRDSRFEGFVKYSRTICNKISCTRREIIGGSFTTNKLNPHDIDFLIVLDDTNLTRKERKFIMLEEERKRQEKRIREGMIEQVKAGYIDINLISCCDNFFIRHQLPKAKTYKQYLETKNYWVNQFGKTRKNKDGKQIKRGVVDLELNSTTFEGI